MSYYQQTIFAHRPDWLYLIYTYVSQFQFQWATCPAYETTFAAATSFGVKNRTLANIFYGGIYLCRFASFGVAFGHRLPRMRKEFHQWLPPPNDTI